MPSRPDLREIARNVRDAFADMDRETLLEILTFVLKEYVVEGPPPMLMHQAETLSDLQNASFAQIITALQTRFDHPELAMFVVDGETVGVRVGGVVQPLVAARQPMQPVAAAPSPPQPGVRVVETTQQRPPAAPAPQPAPPASAPPPTRGMSIRGRPQGDAAAPEAAPPAPAPAPAAPAAPQPPAADKPESPGGDDASARFSLLELD
jgi:hypothetical protein